MTSPTATITLAEPWTYHTIERTIDFPAGVHTVDPAIAAAAPKQEASDGDTGNIAAADPPRPYRTRKG